MTPPTPSLREQRLSEGLCPECGTRLYKLVKSRFSVKAALFRKSTENESTENIKFVPLTLPGVVERGQCMKCTGVGGDLGSSNRSNSSNNNDAPTAKAVPVVKSPAMAYAQDARIASDDEIEDLLGLMEADARPTKRSSQHSSSSHHSDNYTRQETNSSAYSTDTEYEDVPLLDIAGMDLKDPAVGGVPYVHSDSAGDYDELLLPITDEGLESHFTAAAASVAAENKSEEMKMPSKPRALDCPDGMSPDVFYQLPPEVQREVSQHGSNSSNGDIDPDTLASLPKHLRDGVLEVGTTKTEEDSFVPQQLNRKSLTNKERELSNSTKNFLQGYEIGEEDFKQLDADIQNDLLAEKAKLNNNGRVEKMRNSHGENPLTKSTKVFLAEFDINEEDFDDLDDDTKNDLLAQKTRSSVNSNQESEISNTSNYDPELLASLPEDLRNELLEEERAKNQRLAEERSRQQRTHHTIGAHCVNIPAGYDPDTFEALPLEMQQELMEAANGGIVYSAEGYGSDSIVNAPLVAATTVRQEKAMYEGEYNNAGKRHGEGTLTWANGDVYVGTFKNGFMEGRGTISFHDGTEYSGQWRRNRFHGNGTRRFKNGNVYNGNYEGGKRHGQGKCYFANGDLYSGDWKNDTIQGFGRYYYNNGHSFEGMFRNGQRNGRGKYQLTDGRVEIYRYVNDSRVGDGVRWSADRKKAWRMNDGKVVKRVSMEDATAIANRCGPVVDET